MILTDLIAFVGLVMPVVGAVESAHHAKAGFLVYALVISVGLAVGMLVTWAWYSLFSEIGNRSKTYSAHRLKWYLSALFVGQIVWIFFAVLLGNWITSAAIQLVG